VVKNMFDSPVTFFMLSIAAILVVAALGSWLYLVVKARRATVSIPESDLTTAEAGTAAAVLPPEMPQVKHAFDFIDDQLTMILEMPVDALQDDDVLAEVWIDTVSLARMAWLDVQKGVLTPAEETADIQTETLDESQITREHLESSLQRLHDSAERRRELRLKLSERHEAASRAAA